MNDGTKTILVILYLLGNAAIFMERLLSFLFVFTRLIMLSDSIITGGEEERNTFSSTAMEFHLRGTTFTSVSLTSFFSSSNRNQRSCCCPEAQLCLCSHSSTKKLSLLVWLTQKKKEEKEENFSLTLDLIKASRHLGEQHRSYR